MENFRQSCAGTRRIIGLDQFAQNFGLVTDFLSEMPDPVLEQYNNTLNWVLSDTALSARDKALVAFGAATAIHCAY